MTDEYVAKIDYIGDRSYAIYKWHARIMKDGREVTNESSDWRWWLVVWAYLRASGLRRVDRQHARNSKKPSREFKV